MQPSEILPARHLGKLLGRLHGSTQRVYHFLRRETKGKPAHGAGVVSEAKEEPMPSEGSRGELGLPQERIIYGFDEAATGLAGGTISRGQALKLTGSALLGGGLLAMFAGAADAQEAQCRDRAAINNNCRCATTVRNVKTCVTFRNRSCPRRNECNSTRNCRRGEQCVLVGGCCGHKKRHLCAPKC